MKFIYNGMTQKSISYSFPDTYEYSTFLIFGLYSESIYIVLRSSVL